MMNIIFSAKKSAQIQQDLIGKLCSTTAQILIGFNLPTDDHAHKTLNEERCWEVKVKIKQSKVMESWQSHCIWGVITNRRPTWRNFQWTWRDHRKEALQQYGERYKGAVVYNLSWCLKEAVEPPGINPQAQSQGLNAHSTRKSELDSRGEIPGMMRRALEGERSS